MRQKSDPAFPITGWTGSTSDNTGMTLRDYFAGQILQGAFGLSDFYAMSSGSIAMMTYDLADAMLVERESRNQNQEELK